MQVSPGLAYGVQCDQDEKPGVPISSVSRAESIRDTRVELELVGEKKGVTCISRDGSDTVTGSCVVM